MKKTSELLKESYNNVGLNQQMATDPAQQDPETMFTEQVTSVLMQYISSKIPWLRPDSKLNIVSTDLDKNSLVASMDLKVGDTVIRIPILFSQGKIVDPWAIYIEGENKFIPLSEAWYNKLILTLENNTGDFVDYSQGGYQNAINEANSVVSSREINPGYYVRYAALNKFRLKELMPLVKLSMANGYVYESFGRDVIKVASQKLLESKLVKKINKEATFVLNDGYFLVTKESLPKISGLRFDDKINIYNEILKEDFAVVDRRKNLHKSAAMSMVEYTENNPENFIDSTLLPEYYVKFLASFDKKTGEPIYYLPRIDYVNNPYYYKEVINESRDRIKAKYKNKAIIVNKKCNSEFIELLDDSKVKTLPEFIRRVFDGDYFGYMDDAREAKKYYVVPIDSGVFSYSALLESQSFEAVKEDLGAFKIEKFEDGYLKDYLGNRFVLIDAGVAAKIMYTDFFDFIDTSASLSDYLSGSYVIKRNYNGDYYDITVSKKEASIKLDYLNKAAALFVMGNYLSIPDPKELLSNIKPSAHKKIAANVDAGLVQKLEMLASEIQNIKTQLTQPEVQKSTLDSSGKKNGMTINIESLNMGGQSEPAVPGAEAQVPAEGGAPAPAAGGTPDINTLIMEAQKIGIPQDLIDSMIAIAPQLGATPEEMLIQAGALVEQTINSGMPVEEALNQIRNSINQLSAQSGGQAQASTGAAAATPDQYMANPEQMPVSMDENIQASGQQMVNSPAAQGVPMGSAPVAQMAQDPNLQAGVPGVVPQDDMKEVLDRSVLADIIANATVKTDFMEYIPVLNDTINKISEMILKIELSKTKLSEQIGIEQIDDTLDKLKAILKQMGDLVINVINLK